MHRCNHSVRSLIMAATPEIATWQQQGLWKGAWLRLWNRGKNGQGTDCALAREKAEWFLPEGTRNERGLVAKAVGETLTAKVSCSKTARAKGFVFTMEKAWKSWRLESAFLGLSNHKVKSLTFIFPSTTFFYFHFSFFFFMVLGFELRALHLLGRNSATWRMLPTRLL
jgi:hypothetical protein